MQIQALTIWFEHPS